MGLDTFSDFIAIYGDTFKTDAEAELGFKMYLKAKYSGLNVVLGRLGGSDGSDGSDGTREMEGTDWEVLQLPDHLWTVAINDVWLRGVMDRDVGEEEEDLRLPKDGVEQNVRALNDRLDVLNHVATVLPDLAMVRVRRAGVLSQLHRDEEARMELDRAIELVSTLIPHPGTAPSAGAQRPGRPRIRLLAHYLRSRVLQSLGLDDEALTDISSVVEIVEDKSEPLAMRATLLTRLGRFDEAREDLDHAIEIAPDSFRGYFQRGKLLRSLGCAEEALDDASRVVELVLDNAGPLRDRAELLIQLERLDEARADLDRVIELDGDDYWALFQRSVILLSQGLSEPALEDLARTIALLPSHPKPRVQRAKVLGQLDRRDEAEQDLKRALELDPGDDEALYCLAQIAALRGDGGNATHFLGLLLAAGHSLTHRELDEDAAFDSVRENPEFASFAGLLGQ